MIVTITDVSTPLVLFDKPVGNTTILCAEAEHFGHNQSQLSRRVFTITLVVLYSLRSSFQLYKWGIQRHRIDSTSFQKVWHFPFLRSGSCIALIVEREIDDESESSNTILSIDGDSLGERCKCCLNIKLVNKPCGIERGCREKLLADGVWTGRGDESSEEWFFPFLRWMLIRDVFCYQSLRYCLFLLRSKRCVLFLYVDWSSRPCGFRQTNTEKKDKLWIMQLVSAAFLDPKTICNFLPDCIDDECGLRFDCLSPYQCQRGKQPISTTINSWWRIPIATGNSTKFFLVFGLSSFLVLIVLFPVIAFLQTRADKSNVLFAVIYLFLFHFQIGLYTSHSTSYSNMVMKQPHEDYHVSLDCTFLSLALTTKAIFHSRSIRDHSSEELSISIALWLWVQI